MEDFPTLLSPRDRSSRQKINKETLGLNDTIDQLDLTYLYKVFHPETADIHSYMHPMELSPKQIIFRLQGKS
jgi:hypothetical protein